MDIKNCQKLELDKILAAVSEHAVLDESRALITNLSPSCDINDVRAKLAFTAECDSLLYKYGVSKCEDFGDLFEGLQRAEKGAALSCAELLEVNKLNRSARCAFEAFNRVPAEEIPTVKAKAEKLYFNVNLENDITEKIISADGLSDHASEKLYSIRSRIRSLNEKIRSTLSEYVSGKNADYLQDAVVTMRNDRYVIPVKAEYKGRVRGFVHDRSKTGATFFIEPEYVLELNNELVDLAIDEKVEVEAVLKGLSARVGAMAAQLRLDSAVLAEIDSYFARAEYAYLQKAVCPEINGKGCINIIKGRHPLIDKNKVVPVSVELGSGYNFLLLSGANTGGKTVTLKMIGLFCLMAACGLFVPAAAGTSLPVFSSIFCDVGDSQSIEDNLSTFSSHMQAVKVICDCADSQSLVLIDELGGGTNPDEGQALAKAVVKRLLKLGCRGVITTHFTPLKEFAYTTSGIENASMEFDANTLKPLYSIKIGLPGASNALAISRRLGMADDVLNDAMSYLSEGARNFENIMQRAEESRVEADRKLAEAEKLRRELSEKLNSVNAKIEELNREREKISRSARTESRRIVQERTARAEEILDEIEAIFKKAEVTESDLIRARTLKNRLKDSAFDEQEDEKKQLDYSPATADNLKVGAEVFVKPIESRGKVLSLNKKGEAEIECGSLKMFMKYSDLLIIGQQQKNKQKIKVVKTLPKNQPVLEINLLGMTVEEALYETDNFIDKAVLDNLEEIKIIHGVGTGKLRKAIAEKLKKDRRVESFRLGNYGEGETGVTFVKLK